MKTSTIHWLDSALILSPVFFGCFVPDSTSLKLWWQWIMPLFSIIVYWSTIFYIRYKKPDLEGQPIIRWALFFIALLSLTTSLILFEIDRGMSQNGTSILLILMGAMFMVIGNFLPKVKPNTLIGIRTKWALENDENWTTTQRKSGFLWVFCGFMMMIAVLFPHPWLLFTLFLLLAVFGSVWISYSKACQQKREGTYSIDLSQEELRFSKAGKILLGSIRALSLLLCLLVLFLGKYTIILAPEQLKIDATLEADRTIPYPSIEAIEYRDDLDPGEKIVGYGTSALKMGEFRNQEFGDYTLYIHPNAKGAIVLDTSEGIVVINEETETETRSLYERIKKAMADH